MSPRPYLSRATLRVRCLRIRVSLSSGCALRIEEITKKEYLDGSQTVSFSCFHTAHITDGQRIYFFVAVSCSSDPPRAAELCEVREKF